MAQFKSHAPEQAASPNDSWKLDAGHHVSTDMRNLPTLAVKPTVEVLREKLVEADDHATFNCFADLPPEIRTRIYELYFKSFDDSEHIQCQPPITLASRLTRNESLPLFYSSCRFTFDVTTGDLSTYKCLMEWSTTLFLELTTAPDFSRIRSLKLLLRPGPNKSTIFIDIDDANFPVKIPEGLPLSGNPIWRFFTSLQTWQEVTEIHDRTLQELNAITKGIAARPKIDGALRKEDIAAFRNSLQRITNELY